MFIYPQAQLLAIAATFLLFWAIPRSLPRVRALLLLGVSALLVFLVSPTALGLAVLASAIAWAGSRPALLRFHPATVVLIAALLPILHWARPSGGGLEIVGLAYVVLKSISVVVDTARGGKPPPAADVLLLNLFFPIYSAGPIERVGKTAAAGMDRAFDPWQCASGLVRIAIGLAKTTILVAVLVDGTLARSFPGMAEAPGNYAPHAVLAYMALKWLGLYLGFGGYTDIAIGTGRLFGIELSENFRLPFLAANIQDYWKRWHLSMSTFVSNYLFMPFVRRTGKVSLGLFMAFGIIGTWHALTVNYLIWGMLHGSALAGEYHWRRYAKLHPAVDRFTASLPWSLAGRAVTLVFVWWVSMIGTTGSLGEAWRLTCALIGVRP